MRGLAAEALELACREYDTGRGDQRAVDELVAQAGTFWGVLTDLSEWRALARRQRLGPAWVKRSGMGPTRALRRRVLARLRKFRWRMAGT